MAGFSAYTGLSGSGKSYNVVSHCILPALKKNQKVWTNIPLVLEEIEKDYDSNLVNIFDVDDIKENENWFIDVLPKGALLVLDEIQMIFPSGLKATSIPEPVKEFFTQYRHRVGIDGHTTEFVIVTQDLANTANYIRSLIGLTYRHVKLESLGLNRFNVHIYQGPAIGPNPPERNKIRQTGPHKYSPEVYKYYKSATASDIDSVGDESRADKRGSIFRNSTLWWSVVFFVGVVGFVSYYLYQGYVDVTTYDETVVSTVDLDNDQPVRIQKVPKKKNDPLVDLDLYISSNIGVFPRINYRVVARNDTTSVTLDIQQLRALGYSIEPIDPCLMILTQDEIKRTVLCLLPYDDQERSGFISEHI